MFECGNTYYFTAILTGGKRDTRWKPKTLLLDIMCDGIMFRDHCWVRPCKRINKHTPSSHDKIKTKIAFSARVEEYISSQGKKLGLRHIRQVVELGRIAKNARANTKD